MDIEYTKEDDQPFFPELSATETLIKAMESLEKEGKRIDRILIIGMTGDGMTIRKTSNARSSAEAYGMLHEALDIWYMEDED